MASYPSINLPPSRLDTWLARGVADHTARPIEKSLRVATWLADEKILLSAAALFWLSSRGRREPSLQHCADQILMSAVISSALPHVIKLFVARERPDRTVIHGFRHGVPRSGNAWDSFPSGHALHLGALAAAGSRLMSETSGHVIWLSAAALASTRVFLLAHYLTDVLGGLTIGIFVDHIVRRLRRFSHPEELAQSPDEDR
jgi:membrane-associated phospholipid phosphatase